MAGTIVTIQTNLDIDLNFNKIDNVSKNLETENQKQYMVFSYSNLKISSDFERKISNALQKFKESRKSQTFSNLQKPNRFLSKDIDYLENLFFNLKIN